MNQYFLRSSDIPFKSPQDGILEGSYRHGATAYRCMQQCMKLMPNKCLAVFNYGVKKWEYVPC
jgi:hypothetical protein